MDANRILIVGCGPGGAEYLLPAARKAALGADCLVGSARLFELFPDTTAKRIPVGADLNALLDTIGDRRQRMTVAVLVSGDPGFYSLSRRVLDRFGIDACTVIPGVSSVQVACSRLGLDWQQATILSAHARTPDVSFEALKSSPVILALTGGSDSLPWLREALSQLHETHHAWRCVDLTLPGEQVEQIDASVSDDVLTAQRMLIVWRQREGA